ncbi:MAG: tetratricopeptide repeat protein, partial [Candidatus Nitrosopolaris sp.]
HILTFGYAVGGYQNNTLTEVSPNHIEFIDIHHNIIHLMRYHALPSFTLQLVPKNTNLLYQEGQDQANLHNYTGAFSVYEQGLAIEPHNVEILSDMGRVLYNLKNYTGAIQSLNKALAINPNHVYVLEQKGFLLYELGHYREALASLNKALELTSMSTDANVYGILNDKGLALMKLGYYNEALSTFDAAINTQPYTDSAYYYKALTFVFMDFHMHNFGDMNTALQNLNKALSINSDNKEASILKGLVTQFLRTT